MQRFVGKFVGTVLGGALAGLGGAFLGFILGHLHDMRTLLPRQDHSMQQDLFPDFVMSPHQKTIFSVSVIVLGAKLAKVDGHVSREEVLAFRRVFRTPPGQLQQVGELFDQARLSADDYEPHAARLAGAFAYMPSILEEILAGLFYIAIADSPHLSRTEITYLQRVASIFGFNADEFRRIAARVGIYMTSKPPKEKKPPIDNSAYAILGLPPTAGKKEIKKTYHALIRKHHPDMLHAQGASEATLAAATEQMKKINQAYTTICKEKGIK